MQAVLIVSHGSHSPKTKQEIKALVLKFKGKTHIPIIAYAILEIEKPSIPEGIQNCFDQGAREIKILLNFLNSGQHVDQDIPQLVKEARLKYPGLTIKISSPVGQHEGIVDLFLDLMKRT